MHRSVLLWLQLSLLLLLVHPSISNRAGYPVCIFIARICELILFFVSSFSIGGGVVFSVSPCGTGRGWWRV